MHKQILSLMFAATLVGAATPSHAGPLATIAAKVRKALGRKAPAAAERIEPTLAAPVAKASTTTPAPKAKPTAKVEIKEAPVVKEAPVAKAAPVAPRVAVPKKVAQLTKVSPAHELLTGLAPEDYKESLAYTAKPDSVVLPAAQTGGKTHTLVWFHGAGQIPNNIIIRRLARAFAAEGLSVEVHSLEYMAKDFEAQLADVLSKQNEPVFIGGHSAGTGVADHLASMPNAKIKGAILLNGAHGDSAVVPTLQLKGSVMDGEAVSYNPLVTPVQVMHGDHSLRYQAPDGSGPSDKDERNRSVNTWELNREVARHMKAFIEGVK